MNFSKALEAMKAGKKVRRMSWPVGTYSVHGTKEQYGYDTFIIRCVKDGLYSTERFTFLNDDIFADDWEIVEDQDTLAKIQIRYYAICPICEREYRVRSDSTYVICGKCGRSLRVEIPKQHHEVDKESESTLEKIGFTLDFGDGLFSEIAINPIIKDFYISKGIKYPETRGEALKILDELSTFRVPPSEISTLKGFVNAETSQSMRREWNLVYDQWLRFC